MTNEKTGLICSTFPQINITMCDVCSGNPCRNNGVCQEAYTDVGHKCICPAGFSGGLCENTGDSCYLGKDYSPYC